MTTFAMRSKCKYRANEAICGGCAVLSVVQIYQLKHVRLSARNLLSLTGFRKLSRMEVPSKFQRCLIAFVFVSSSEGKGLSFQKRQLYNILISIDFDLVLGHWFLIFSRTLITTAPTLHIRVLLEG